MQPHCKGYINVLVCAPLGPQHSEEGGHFSVCVGHFVCKLLQCCTSVFRSRLCVDRAHIFMHWAPKCLTPALFKCRLYPPYGTVPSRIDARHMSRYAQL
jgi:hypothetical protein